MEIQSLTCISSTVSILHMSVATSIFFCELSIHSFSFFFPPFFLWVIRLFLIDWEELITF